MKNPLYLILFALLFTIACGGEQSAVKSPEAAGADKTLAAYTGTFEGIMPCNGCEGIDTELSLNADGTFSLIEFYLSKEADLYLTEGTWRLSGDLSHIILTPSTPDEGPVAIHFALKGIDLVKLDIFARQIESNLNYTLRRK